MSDIYFLAGMPRSGSTLLANLLAQNPRMVSSGTSGVIDVLRAIRDTCDNNQFFKAMGAKRREATKLALLRGAMNGCVAQFEGRAYIDKSRGWPTVFELLGTILGDRKRIKSIICVRDLRDVLASFEKLYRVTGQTSTTTQERANFGKHRTALGRAEFIIQPSEPLGYAIDVIRDAVTRGWRDQMFFVDYDMLCSNPEITMRNIYEFLGEDLFSHDFENVKQVIKEDDSIHGFTGLHDIRQKIEIQEEQWSKVFDDAIFLTPFWARVTKSSRWWERIK